MRILVTGGTGFLGRRVVAALLRRHYEVRCVVRSAQSGEALTASLPPEARDRVELVTGSLLNAEQCLAMVKGCDQVVHVAAAKSGSPSVLFLNTVTTTRTLVAAAERAKVSRFVLVSSLGVYGTRTLSRGSELTEACALDPAPAARDPYTFSKVVQEQVCWEAYAKGLPLVVVRPGVIYGPGADYLSARVGLRVGNTMVRFGGSNRLPYVFVDNCAEAIACAACTPGIEGSAFNVIDDELPTGRQLLRAYRSRVAPLRVLPIPSAAVPLLSRAYEWYCERSDGLLPPVLTRYRSDAQWKPLRYPNRRARTMLSWNPAVSLDEGIRRTTEYLRAKGA